MAVRASSRLGQPCSTSPRPGGTLGTGGPAWSLPGPVSERYVKGAGAGSLFSYLDRTTTPSGQRRHARRAAEAVPAGSWSPQRPRRSLTPTGRGSWLPARGPPTVLALDPGRCPAVFPIEGGEGRGPWASDPLVSEPFALRSPPDAVVSQSGFNLGKLFRGLCPLPFIKYCDHY